MYYYQFKYYQLPLLLEKRNKRCDIGRSPEFGQSTVHLCHHVNSFCYETQGKMGHKGLFLRH